MADAGLGADIVSAGRAASRAARGHSADRIVFSGVGKTDEEIAEALAAGIWRFNVESRTSCSRCSASRGAHGRRDAAAVRINPDVDAGTHEKISTGKAENKFGVSIDEARRWFGGASELTYVRLDGLHVHIGSQILSLEPFRLALERVAAFCARAGRGWPRDPQHRCRRRPRRALSQRPRANRSRRAAYAARHPRTHSADFNGRIVLEPGRYLVAEAGMLADARHPREAGRRAARSWSSMPR